MRQKLVYFVIVNVQRNRFNQFVTTDRFGSDDAPVMWGPAVMEKYGACTNESESAQSMSAKNGKDI